MKRNLTTMNDVDNKPQRHVGDGFFFMADGYYRKVLYRDILWIEADGNYSYLHLCDGKTLCVIQPLLRVKEFLPVCTFIRIHRSHIVNIHAIDRFVGNMVYIGKKRLDVSRTYREEIFSCFDVLERKRNHDDGDDQ